MLRLTRIIAQLALVIFSTTVKSNCLTSDQDLQIKISPDVITRQSIPKELFGFNLPWRDFQNGYFRHSQVKNEVIRWLLPFEGALYRYPGGNVSNWFNWRNAIGPEEYRSANLADFGQKSQVRFGLDELSKFIKQVNGKVIYTINMYGDFQEQKSINEIAQENLDLFNYIKNTSSFKCVGGENCSIIAWELGNEVDLPPLSWDTTMYIERSTKILDLLKIKYPEMRWVASGKTSPWDARSKDYTSFNNDVAQSLGSKIAGITIHPYYDGINIPSAISYTNSYATVAAKFIPNGKLYITEHARWPKVPETGDWSQNWHQATNIGGAISSADFILNIIKDERIAGANWHALGLSGPWQLFRLDRKTDHVYPSPVYWGLLTLRKSMQDNLVHTDFKDHRKPFYSGGYDTNIISTISKKGDLIGILGINRSPTYRKFIINLNSRTKKFGTGSLQLTSGKTSDTDNTDIAQSAITMLTTTINPEETSHCIPPFSVFSINRKLLAQ